MKDYQGVPVPAPLPPNVFDEPIYTQLNAADQRDRPDRGKRGRVHGRRPCGVMLNNGECSGPTVSGAPSGSAITIAAPLPFAAASGNDVIDYAVHIPALPYANLGTG